MKKLVLTLSALLFAATLSFAQDMAEATQMAKDAQEAYSNKEFAKAFEGFQKALTIAEACGEEGAELLDQCKTALPQIAMSIAKEKINAQDYDGGLAELQKVIEISDKYGAIDVLAEAKDLVPAVEQQKGNALFAAADELYQAGKLDEALTAFQALKEAGNANAIKRIPTVFLKMAQAAYKEGKLDAAINAVKSAVTESGGSAAIKKTAGSIVQGAIQKAATTGKLSDAGSYYNLLTELDPGNANLGVLAYTLGASYYKAKNNSQAKSWLQKAVNDPKYGANAQQLLKALQ